MTVNERIKYLKEFYKKRGIDFPKRLKIPSSTLNGVIGTRGSTPSHTLLEAILTTFPEVNINWLILGKGKVWKKVDTKSNGNDRVEGLEVKYKELENSVKEVKKLLIEQSDSIIEFAKEFENVKLIKTLTKISNKLDSDSNK